jgi:hypothetical protein
MNIMDGLPIKNDENAESADPNLPAFLARPKEAPVYHGFEVLADSEKDGWAYGVITEYESEDEEICEGDGFVIAPDGSRAGVVWATDTPDFYEILGPDEERWGVYGVKFPSGVKNKNDLITNFHAVLPHFKKRFKELNE